jgi:hypothetical protein
VCRESGTDRVRGRAVPGTRVTSGRRQRQARDRRLCTMFTCRHNLGVALPNTCRQGARRCRIYSEIGPSPHVNAVHRTKQALM